MRTPYLRIVSLLPSATEIVCALGLSEHLVGISHDCDYPAEILDRRVLSDAIVAGQEPSGRIDARIREQVHRGKSVYHLDAEALAMLQPDLILTQELCEVCAPSFNDVREAVRVLQGQARLVSLEPHGLDDILSTILEIGIQTGTEIAARALLRRLRDRIAQVQRLTRPEPPPRVLCLEWLDPLFVAGHWVPEMVEVAGGADGLGRARRDSYVIEWDEVVAYAPQVIVVMPCGFDIECSRTQIHLLTERPGWDGLPAVRTGRVFLTDASAYFSRPGPRAVRGLEILAELVRADRGPLSIDGAVQLGT